MGAGLHVGVAERIYYNSATYNSPTWVAIAIAGDVSINLEKSMSEVKSRASSWATNLPALKSADLEFDVLGDKSNTAYDVLRDYFINDTLADFAVADQAIATTGCEYFRAQYYLSGFSIDEKLENAETAKVTAKLGYSTNAPAFVNV
jgi:hypothetical protein